MAKLVLKSRKVNSSQALGPSLGIALGNALDSVPGMEWTIEMTAVKLRIIWHGIQNGNDLKTWWSQVL